MSTDLAVREVSMLRPLVKPDELIAAQNDVTQLIVRALKRGVDYGQVPGTKSKDTLFKPGAERLQKAFGCHTVYEVVEQDVDHDRKVEWTKLQYNYQSKRREEMAGTSQGLYRYVIRATVISQSGMAVGSGMGSCSTMESKYVDRPRDLENTVLKMAQKRAKISATLDAFGLSDRFTQDVADDPTDDHVKSDDEGTQKKQPTGFDPQNREHQNALIKQLRAKKVDESKFDDIAIALTSKSFIDIDSVIIEIESRI